MRGGADLGLRRVEVHTAVLLVMGDRVLEVEKAVDLGFGALERVARP